MQTPETPVRFGPEERVLKPFPLDHLVILGGGPSGYAWASSACLREDTRDAQVWAITGSAYVYQHHLMWDMHDHKRWEGWRRQRVIDNPSPVVMPRTAPDIPHSLEYPMHEVVQRWGQTYFRGGTFCYMIAFAMLCFELSEKKSQVLELYGCDWSYPGLPSIEAGRFNAEFWLGMAAARGNLELRVPQNATIMDADKRHLGLYGYDFQPQFERGDDDKMHLTNFEGWSGQFNIEQALPGDSIREAAE